MCLPRHQWSWMLREDLWQHISWCRTLHRLKILDTIPRTKSSIRSRTVWIEGSCMANCTRLISLCLSVCDRISVYSTQQTPCGISNADLSSSSWIRLFQMPQTFVKLFQSGSDFGGLNCQWCMVLFLAQFRRFTVDRALHKLLQWHQFISQCLHR